MNKKIISFLASGRGSNFKKIAENIHAGLIQAGFGVLVSDKKDAPALQIAKDMGIAGIFVDPTDFAKREDYDARLRDIFDDYKTDLIVAAGYMRILTPVIIAAYKNRIINIHPALLPSFKGLNAQKQALEYGVKISGCTVHFIDEGTDTGPIILQKEVAVNPDDTEKSLSARILVEEHRVYSEAVKLFCEDLIIVEDRKVIIRF